MKSFNKTIVIIVALIVFVEAIAVLFLLDKSNMENMIGDEIFYHRIASNLVDYQSYSFNDAHTPTISRTPGYTFFIAFLYLISGKSFLFVYATQFLVLGLTAIFLYRLSRYFTGERESILSAILCATYPPLVFLASYHYTEVLATFFAVLITLCFVETIHSRKPILRYAILGFLFGCLTLIRPSLSLVIGLFVIGILLNKASHSLKKRIVFVAVISSVFLLTIAPWVTRNIFVTKQFIPFATGGGESLWISAIQYEGKLSYAMPVDEWRRYIETRDAKETAINKELDNPQSQLSQRVNKELPRQLKVEILLENQFKEEGKTEFGKISVATIIKGIPKRFAYLWSTLDTSPYSATNGLFHRFVQISYVLLILLFLIGIVLSFKSLLSQYALWLFPVYLTFFHLIFHVEPRYSMPGRFFLFIYAGIAMVRIFDLIKARKKLPDKVETSAK